MDNKVIIIFFLSLLLVGVAVYGIIQYKDTTGNPRQDISSFQQQEKQYINENTQKLLAQNNEQYYRQENRGLYHMESYYQNRDFRKAMLMYESGQYKEALHLFTEIKVDSYDPDTSSMAYYYIASSLVKLGEDQKARPFLQRIVQNLRSDYWTTKAVIQLGEINRKYQFVDQSMEVYLHKLYMETPDAAQQNEILTQLGYLNLFRGSLDDAMELFQRSNTVLARLGQARVFVKKDMYWKAISIYEDFLAHKNFENEMYFNDVQHAFLIQTYHYAKQWLDKNDYDHAFFYFRKIVNFFPNSMQGEASLFWIGEIFLRRKVYNTALRYYNLALSNGNRNKDADAQFKKAVTYYEMKQYAESLRNFQKVVDYYKNSAYVERSRQYISMLQNELIYRN